MNVLFGTLPSFLVLLGVLVFVHELGHFLVAKKLGIKVLKFSLGFGPVLWSRKRGETEYLISVIPLGGYVKLHGEDPDEPAEEDSDRSFSERPVSHRMATVIAGPLMNFFLAIVFFAFLSLFGTQIHQPVVGEVSEGMPAAEAGILPGDRVVAVDGIDVRTWEDMAALIRASGGRALELTIVRPGEELVITLTPTFSDVEGEEKKVPLVGIVSALKVDYVETPVWKAPWMGLKETWRWTWFTIDIVGNMLAGKADPKNIGGPIAIADMAGKAAEAGILQFMALMAILSVNLGVLNLLPIPVLDGGHMVFFIIEALKGEPLSVVFREKLQWAGLALLVTLMVFVMYNDILRIITG